MNEDGSSECHFAEQLYAKHEELRAELQGILGQAHEYLTAVEGEITRLAHDLAVLSAHEDRLHREGPRAHFSEAEARGAALYNRYRELRQQIVETIKCIDQALQEASTKRFPGGVPRRWPGLEPAAPVRQKPADGGMGASGQQELDALFEMDRGDREKS